MESVRKAHLKPLPAWRKLQIMSLGSELEYQAEALQNHPAIVFEDRIITFGELNSLA